MTPMVVYDCQKCGNHSARKLDEMPWHCDHCDTDIAVGNDRDITIVFVQDEQTPQSFAPKQNYTYSKEIFTERGIEAYEVVNA